MEKNLQVQIFGTVLRFRLSQLAKKYGGELVARIWKEMIIGGRDQSYFRDCGWKSEMTLMEALECLDDVCDFIEAKIQKNQQKENGIANHYIPVLFN